MLALLCAGTCLFALLHARRAARAGLGCTWVPAAVRLRSISREVSVTSNAFHLKVDSFEIILPLDSPSMARGSLSLPIAPPPRFKLVDTAGVRKRTAVASSKDGAEVGLLPLCIATAFFHWVATNCTQLPAVVARRAAQLLMLQCVRPCVAAAVPRRPSVCVIHLLLVAAENLCLG